MEEFCPLTELRQIGPQGPRHYEHKPGSRHHLEVPWVHLQSTWKPGQANRGLQGPLLCAGALWRTRAPTATRPCLCLPQQKPGLCWLGPLASLMSLLLPLSGALRYTAGRGMTLSQSARTLTPHDISPASSNQGPHFVSHVSRPRFDRHHSAMGPGM